MRLTVGDAVGVERLAPLHARLSCAAMAARGLEAYDAVEVHCAGKRVLCVAVPSLAVLDDEVEVHAWVEAYLGAEDVCAAKAPDAGDSRLIRIAPATPAPFGDYGDAARDVTKALRRERRAGVAVGVHTGRGVSAFLVVESLQGGADVKVEFDTSKTPWTSAVAPRTTGGAALGACVDCLRAFCSVAESNWGRGADEGGAMRGARAPALAVTGAPGVGKTDVVRAACDIVRAENGVGSVWVDARRLVLEASSASWHSGGVVDVSGGLVSAGAASATLADAVAFAAATRRPTILVVDDFGEVIKGARASKDAAFAASEHRRLPGELGASLRVAEQLDRAARENPLLFLIAVAGNDFGQLPDASQRADSCLNPKRYERTVDLAFPDGDARREMLDNVVGALLPRSGGDVSTAFVNVSAGLSRAAVAEALDAAAVAAFARGAEFVEWSDISAGVDAATQSDDAAERIVPPLDDAPTPARAAWPDVGGLRDAKEALTKALVWPRTRAAALRRFGVRPPRGVVLHGPPGCGKTLLARAVAREIDAAFISVRCSELLKAYLGESETALRDAFARARAARPCVLFFDEVDAIGASRANVDVANGSTVHVRLVATLLTELDGVEQGNEGLTVLAATHRLETLDAALVRPGRLEDKVFVGPPDSEDRTDILKKCAPHVGPDADLSKLAADTAGWSAAMLVSLCRDAAFAAIEDSPLNRYVAQRHFDRAWALRLQQHAISGAAQPPQNAAAPQYCFV